MSTASCRFSKRASRARVVRCGHRAIGHRRAREPRLSLPRNRAAARTPARERTRSTIWSSPRGCRFSCGAKVRTTSCSSSRPRATCGSQRPAGASAAHARRSARRDARERICARLAQCRRARRGGSRRAAVSRVQRRAYAKTSPTEITLFLASILLEDTQRAGNFDGRSHVLERAARAPLRDRRPSRPAVPARDARRRVRYGLLGKGAVLLRTSYGDRTSPVLRGAWVLDKLMGTPPTPPPPNVETDLTTPAGEQPKTIRARLEQHRADQTCNACHGVIDPYGLALENFTATGHGATSTRRPTRRSTRAPSCRAA